MAETTRDRIIEQYNTYTRRPTVEDPAARKAIFKSFRKVLGPWLRENKRSLILDVACGEGALLAYLRQRGYLSLSGFDLSEENVAICHSIGLEFVDRFDALNLNDYASSGSFAAIFCLDILEHLSKDAASGFLEAARDLLSEDGILIIQTPNMGSVHGLYHRLNDLTHEFCLTEKSAVDVLMTAGFLEREIEVRPRWPGSGDMRVR